MDLFFSPEENGSRSVTNNFMSCFSPTVLQMEQYPIDSRRPGGLCLHGIKEETIPRSHAVLYTVLEEAVNSRTLCIFFFWVTTNNLMLYYKEQDILF